MQVAISNNIYTQAQMYAERKGQDLSAMIERYLLLYIQRNNEAAKDEILDEVTEEPVAEIKEEAFETVNAVETVAEAAAEPAVTVEPEKAETAQDTITVDDSSDDLFV